MKSRKTKLYDKGLRILQREMHRLDLKSKGLKPLGKGLNPYEIKSLVSMMKPLEANIKEEPKAKEEQSLPTPALLRRAREILENHERSKNAQSSSEPSGTNEGNGA